VHARGEATDLPALQRGCLDNILLIFRRVVLSQPLPWIAIAREGEAASQRVVLVLDRENRSSLMPFRLANRAANLREGLADNTTSNCSMRKENRLRCIRPRIIAEIFLNFVPLFSVFRWRLSCVTEKNHGKRIGRGAPGRVGFHRGLPDRREARHFHKLPTENHRIAQQIEDALGSSIGTSSTSS
jgi:hypothetical protein